MAYTALARRYRSQRFDDVVGQEAIARTLRNAIERNRVAHAYLFTGTRGVGKTTTARLFAKALNCPGDQPTEVAQAIMQGRDVDVIEIDAASNNSVNDARDLIANSIYAPMRGPYKIYIIDEVHMLSTAAFNALLKTMEEPPAHVKFILCTTETHKVPATIQSRCQRFDFRNIPTRQIADHLRSVCEQENVKAEPGVLTTIARLGHGSMRDALSLLDRLLAAGDTTISASLLADLLGVADRDLVDAILRAAGEQDPASALARADDLLARGVSIDQLLAALVERLRDLMVILACGAETALVELEPEERADAASLASLFDAPAAVHMIALCESIQQKCKSASSPRALLDAMLVRLAMTARLAEVAAIASGRTDALPSAPATPQKKSDDRVAPASHPAPAQHSPTRPAAQAPPQAPEVWRFITDAAGATASGRALVADLRLGSISDAGDVRLLAAPARVAYLQSKREWLAGLFKDITGRPVRVEIIPDDAAPAPIPGAGPDPMQAARASPAVRRAEELLGARIVRFEPDTQE